MRWRIFTAVYVVLFVLLLGAGCHTIASMGEAHDRREMQACLRKHDVCYKEQGQWLAWTGEL